MPLSFVFDFSLNQDLLFKPEVYFNFLFLGLGASALCFVTWNFAVKILGAVKTGVYQKRSAAKTPSFRAEIIARRNSVFNQVFSAGQYIVG